MQCQTNSGVINKSKVPNEIGLRMQITSLTQLVSARVEVRLSFLACQI
jgi:hypothetical protein